MEQFNFSEPFTLQEFMEHHKIDGVHNPKVTRRIVAELKAKGYTKKYHRRRYRYAKWQEIQTTEFVMPEIP